MALKKKVVMKASVDPIDKEKIVKFDNEVVIPLVKSKIDKPTNGKRQIVKIINGTKIKVIVGLESSKAKVDYSISGEVLISKAYSYVDVFMVDLKEMENNL